jgi:hypothetical protein
VVVPAAAVAGVAGVFWPSARDEPGRARGCAPIAALAVTVLAGAGAASRTAFGAMTAATGAAVGEAALLLLPSVLPSPA